MSELWGVAGLIEIAIAEQYTATVPVVQQLANSVAQSTWGKKASERQLQWQTIVQALTV